ncbi:hypothetical protein [Nocardioides sp.]|uniref:hypothetical protein n=1 Tax=Nocardioides sp. TaxID=35761 RepID=UPI0039E34D94
MTTPPQSIVRRAAVTTGALVAVAACVVAGAGPASADVPAGWAPETHMSWGHLLVICVAIPVGVGVIISLLAALPGLLKGESLTGAAPAGEWLGGPRKGTAELAAPDGETSEAGGASAKW